MSRLAIITRRLTGAPDTIRDNTAGRLYLADPPPGAPACSCCKSPQSAALEVELDQELGTVTLCAPCIIGLLTFATGQLDAFG